MSDVTATAETPVLDTVAALTTASIERCHLENDELMLVRLAALAAVDARPISYLANLGAAVDSGVTIEQVQDVLVAIAPIIGTPRVVSAAVGVTEALGLAIIAGEDASPPGE
jgi:alkylhydroperoxidase/carboxymuconolactone decarboxylase family protein YurZ